MNKNLFDFKHYKPYITSRTGAKGTKKGIKTALARALGCQPTYLSQVLHANADLSLEQADRCNEFFGHSREEAAFFLLLVQKDRAGSASLSRHFQEQIDDILQRRQILAKRLGEKAVLGPEVQSVYYSSWVYAAVHIALTIPELRSRETLAVYLNLLPHRVTEILDFLLSVGLAVAGPKGYLPGESHIRLNSESHNLVRHHANWRTRALESLERWQIADLHYSGVVSLSRSDITRVKEVFIEAVKNAQLIVKDSGEEELCAVSVDFFSLKN